MLEMKSDAWYLRGWSARSGKPTFAEATLGDVAPILDGRCVEKICVVVRYKFLKPGGDSLEKRFSLATAASGYILYHPVPPSGSVCHL
jgi:hypothetical protein